VIFGINTALLLALTIELYVLVWFTSVCIN